MALSATFSADFSSFEKAVTSATTKVVSFEASSNRVKASLERMETSLSGKKLLQDATLAAEAIERIGGVTKLTADELQRFGAQAAEATAKAKALGLEVAPSVEKIAAAARQAADATKQATTQTFNWQNALKSAAGAFGIAFSANALTSFVGSVVDAAGRINDLSLQLGISTQAVQGFKEAAMLGGASIDDVSTAITKMNQNLAGGEDTTVEALNQAGLQFEAIRAMKPEDAFLAITDAVAKIEDPMTRVDVALTLFGKSAATLLPAIMDDFRKVSDAAIKMGDNTVAQLDRAGEAWDALGNRTVVISGGILSKVMSTFTQATSSMEGFKTTMVDVLKYGWEGAMNIADGMAAATAATEKATAAAQKLPPPVQRAAVDMDKLREKLLAAEAEYRGLPPTIDKVAASSDRMGEATVRAATRSTSAIRQMADGLDDVQRKMNAIVQADKDKAAADKAARAAANASSISYQIVGRVTPLGGAEQRNIPQLERRIADLTVRLAASGPSSAVSGGGAAVAARAQEIANDERQLEYLKTLLDVATAMARSAEQRQTAPVTVNVQASGYFDSAAKRELATAIGDELMSTLKLGRQLGTG